jgi:hypothetical protein
MLALMTTDQRKARAVAQFQAQLVKLHQGLLQLEEGIKQASKISLPVEGREERFNPNAEVLASLQKAKAKRERDSSTPAKKQRGTFSTMSGQSGTRGQFGGRQQEQQGTSWQTQPPWQLAPWQPPTYLIPFPQQAVYSQAGYLNGFFPPPPTHIWPHLHSHSFCQW